MKCIHEFDKKDYEQCHNITTRTAIRAIIAKDGKIAMIMSHAFQEVKFPGGGMEKGETHQDCLQREVAEETGLITIPESMKPYGYIKDKRKSTLFDDEIFEMISYYYLVDIRDDVTDSNLDPYEKEYGYHLIWITIDQAIEKNEKALHDYKDQAIWVERELHVLKRLKHEGKYV